MKRRSDGESRGREDEATVRVPNASRTVVIVLAEVTAIVALLVLWSFLRGRSCGEGDSTQ